MTKIKKCNHKKFQPDCKYCMQEVNQMLGWSIKHAGVDANEARDMSNKERIDWYNKYVI